MKLELTRFAYLATATLGWLRAGGLRLATIERPWKENPEGPGGIPRESCVPDGRYIVQPHDSARFPGTYALLNNVLGIYYQPSLIPQGQKYGRSAILIHAGNRVTDVIGCIAVGLAHHETILTITDSRLALSQLQAVLKREMHELTIRPTAGTLEPS